MIRAGHAFLLPNPDPSMHSLPSRGRLFECEAGAHSPTGPMGERNAVKSTPGGPPMLPWSIGYGQNAPASPLCEAPSAPAPFRVRAGCF